jgi:beta-glucanase (GH16 family)
MLGLISGFGLFAGLTAVTASFCEISSSWSIAFEDDFNEPQLNLSSWTPVVGPDVGSCRDAVCTTSEVSIADGALVLTSHNVSSSYNGVKYNYTSGAVNTKGKVHWSRNASFRLCVTAELPGGGPDGNGASYAGTGIWPAVWMMPDDT